jgi:hypothetical protein
LTKLNELNSIISGKRIPAYLKDEANPNQEEKPEFLLTPEFDMIFGQIYHLLNGLRSKASLALALQQKPEKDKTEERHMHKLHQDMRDKFKRFPIHKIMRNPSEVVYKG